LVFASGKDFQDKFKLLQKGLSRVKVLAELGEEEQQAGRGHKLGLFILNLNFSYFSHSFEGFLYSGVWK